MNADRHSSHVIASVLVVALWVQWLVNVARFALLQGILAGPMGAGCGLMVA